MSNVVEFALSTITDYVGFERLANEIMREEGFSDIRPLGGVGDYGQDAAVEKVYSNATERIVFQYSVDKKTIHKLKKTMVTLDKNGVDYSTLVYVTSISITSSVKADLSKYARKTHKKNLIFFDKKALALVLSDPKNGIFDRQFSDIEKQIQSFKASVAELSGDDKTAIELEMLKVNLAFVYSDEAGRTRKKIFDKLIFAIVNSVYPEFISKKDIIERAQGLLPGKAYVKDKITTSLQRLEKEECIEVADGIYKATDKKHTDLELDVNECIDKFNALVVDIVDLAKENHEEPLDDDTIRRARRNVKKAMTAFFRAFGTEITSQYSSKMTSFPVFQKSITLITEECNRQVGEKLGGLLFNSIGEMLAAPKEEHVEALHYLVLAHVANAVMVLDPNLKEFQSTKFSNKTFILDTDFLLNCVVSDIDEHEICIRLVQDLLSMRAKVVVPDSSIDETVLHASCSMRTYNYFNDNLRHLPESIAKEKIYNVFVRGYYLAVKRGRIHPSVHYVRYLHNYYDRENPTAFMREVVKAALPEGVLFQGVEDIYVGGVGEAEYQKVFKEILALAELTKKGRYRDTAENEMYAHVDTSLFLATLKGNDERVKDTILGGSHYLITDSARYRMVAEKLGYKDSVSTRPQSLLSILSVIGASSVSKVDLVKTLENPVLVYTMNELWDEVGKMVQLGLDLSSTSLPRLKATLETRLHSMLTKIDLSKEAANSEEIQELIEAAKGLGYELPPVGKIMEEQLEEKDAQIEELEQQLASKERLEEEIKKFGQRRKKYLRRVGQTK